MRPSCDFSLILFYLNEAEILEIFGNLKKITRYRKKARQNSGKVRTPFFSCGFRDCSVSTGVGREE